MTLSGLSLPPGKRNVQIVAEFVNGEGFADRVVCAETPHPFWGVGMWYADFSQTSDEEVRLLLERAAEAQGEKTP